jgi:hypothetical protein
MPSNFPSAYDTLVELGGPFINVSPPVDPLRDIDANRANNANDSLMAIEARVGRLGEVSTGSLDWATLTVAGAPSQGLRFAGGHVAWPGLQAESGLFIDSSNDHVCFHKTGDPLGTFTDLTTGGGGGGSLQASYNLGGSILTAGALPVSFNLANGGFVVTPSASGSVKFWNGVNNYLLVSTAGTTLSAIAADLTLSNITSGNIALNSLANVSVTTGAAGIFSVNTNDLYIEAATGHVAINSAVPTAGYWLTVDSGGSGGCLSLIGSNRTINSPGGSMVISATVPGSPTIMIESVGENRLSSTGGLVTLSGQGVSMLGNNHTITATPGTTGTFLVSASGTEPGLYIQQNTANSHLMRFDGNAGAGQTPSISTDTSNAFMLKVQVNGSGSSYWIRASDTTMVPFGGVPSWQDIYSTYRTLSEDATEMVWSQIAGSSGSLLKLQRNLAAASTTAPIFYVYNQNASDDQPAVLIQGVSDVSEGTPLAVYKTAGTQPIVDFGDGTYGSSWSPRFSFYTDGTLYITGRSTDPLLWIGQESGGSFLRFYDEDLGEQRWEMFADGHTQCDANSTSTAITVTQAANTGGCMSLYAGASSTGDALYIEQQGSGKIISATDGGSYHFDVYPSGYVDIAANATSPTAALKVDQLGTGPLFDFLGPSSGVSCSNSGCVTITAVSPTEFLWLSGASSADKNSNISTLGAGSFVLQGWIRVHIFSAAKNDDFWIPFYS